MQTITSRTLLDSIKLRAFLPASQATFTDEDLLKLADEAIQSRILPLILKYREEYYLFESHSENIPHRAIGGRIKSVELENRDGNRWRVQRNDNQSISRRGFSISSNKLNFRDRPNDTKVKITYFIRPNALILPEKAAKIVGLGEHIELENHPFKLGDKVDFISSTPLFEHKHIDFEVESCSETGLFCPSRPANLAVGDWIAPSGFTPVPQIPVEFFPLLAQAVTVSVMEALGLDEKAAVADAKLNKMEADLVHLITPRVDGDRRRIINSRPISGMV
jgi:hypothetical protein